MNILEIASTIARSAEALAPHLKRVRGLLPFLTLAPVTPWSAIAGAFGAGVVVGAGAALVLAPKSGAELRGELMKRLESYRMKAQHDHGDPLAGEGAPGEPLPAAGNGTAFTTSDYHA
jgi:hypothetical protein